MCKPISKWKIEKKVWLQTLVDLECTYTKIDKKLVKEEKIKIELIDISLEVFNADRTKNGEVTSSHRFK